MEITYYWLLTKPNPSTALSLIFEIIQDWLQEVDSSKSIIDRRTIFLYQFLIELHSTGALVGSM